MTYSFLTSLETCHWFVFWSSLYYTDPIKYRKFNNLKVHLTAVIKKLIKIWNDRAHEWKKDILTLNY